MIKSTPQQIIAENTDLRFLRRASAGADGENMNGKGSFPMTLTQTRRHCLTTVSAAGAAGLIRPPQALAAEGPLETTSVRLPKFLSVCVSPQYAAEELLRAEGFTDIRYMDTPASAVA